MTMSNPTTLPFVNPATGQQFGQIQTSTAEDVAQAFTDLRHSLPTWRAKSPRERAFALRQFKEALIDRADEVAAVLNKDCGKTMQDGMVEVFITVDNLTQMIHHAPRWLRKKSVPRGLYFFKKYFVEPEPYGVVAVIGPWNYPVVQVMTPVLAALMAGNTVVVKPSEAAPAVGQIFESLFASVPDIAPYVRVLHGGPAVGQAIVSTPPDLIFITGSEKTGVAITKAAAENLTPVIAELGGKDPMIVLEDADISAAAKWGVWAANYHSGQVCMSVERVYVVEAVYEQFVTAVVEEARKFKIGYTTEVNSPYNCGPISFDRQLGIIDEHLQDASKKGAKILTGGTRQGMFIDPVVMVDVDHEMKIMREETFGPIMPIMKVRDEAEAVARANDSDYGLCAYVWSENLGRAERVAKQLEAGSVVINDAMAHYAVSQLPFGGVKKSGNGRIHGEEEVKQFTQTKGYAVGATPFRWDIATVFRHPGHYREMRALMRFAFGSWRQRFTPFADNYPLVPTEQKGQNGMTPVTVPVAQNGTAKKAALAVGVAGLAALTAGVLLAVNRRK